MKPGRIFGNGKAMFKVANCVACHKLDGEGNEFGPDLAKLDPKLKSIDILKDIIEPSFKINEKYQTWVIETKAGKTYTGLILEETPKQIKLIENPLAKAEPIVIMTSGHRHEDEVAGVDHAEGTARQADARGDSRSGGVLDGARQSAASDFPGGGASARASIDAACGLAGVGT